MINLNPEWRERFPVLFMTETEVLEAAAASPVVDAIEAAMGPDHYAVENDDSELDVTVLGPKAVGKAFTPWERRPQRVADEISRLVNEGPGHMFLDPDEMAELPIRVDYLHSELPQRAVLPRIPGGYTPDDLREELIRRGPRPCSRRAALARRERRYINEELSAAVKGPIVKAVIVHGGFLYQHTRSDRLPDGARFAPALIAWPVPQGYTAFRIARMLAADAYGCHWCDEWRGRNAVMLVSTGGALRLIATCADCQDELGEGPDYYLHDPWDAEHGFPRESDR